MYCRTVKIVCLQTPDRTQKFCTEVVSYVMRSFCIFKPRNWHHMSVLWNGPHVCWLSIFSLKGLGSSFCLYILSWGSHSKNTGEVCHSLLQWAMFCQNSSLWADEGACVKSKECGRPPFIEFPAFCLCSAYSSFICLFNTRGLWDWNQWTAGVLQAGEWGLSLWERCEYLQYRE